MVIIESTERPWGVYDIMYFHTENGKLIQDKGCDTNVSLAYVEYIARSLGTNEVIIARCMSQRGELVAFGSEKAQRIFHERDRKQTG